MTGLSDEAFGAVQRLVRDLWQAARDPKLARDPAAVARWQVYAQRKLTSVAEEEAARRLAERESA